MENTQGIMLNKAIKLYVDILYNFCVDVYNYMRSVPKNTRKTYTKIVKSVSPEIYDPSKIYLLCFATFSKFP